MILFINNIIIPFFERGDRDWWGSVCGWFPLYNIEIERSREGQRGSERSTSCTMLVWGGVTCTILYYRITCQISFSSSEIV